MRFITWWPERRRALDAISHSLARIEGKVDRIMTTEADLQTDLDNIKTGVAAVADKLTAQAGTIADLKAQIAAGTPVTPEQLDALHAEASGIASSLQAITAPETSAQADGAGV